MRILYVVLESGSGSEEHQRVFEALSALGYNAQYTLAIGLEPTISVRVRNASAHQAPTEEQIKELEALPAVKEVIRT